MATQFNLPTITIDLNGQPQPAISARDLHQSLRVGKDFTNWIKDRIERYGFIEGEEFSPILAKTSGVFGGRPKTDYLLGLDMARELAMLENNEQGRAIRRALIQMERQFREDIPAILRKQERQLDALKQALLTANPKVARLIRYTEMALTNREIGLLLHCTSAAVRHRQVRLEKAGLLRRKVNPARSLAGRKGNQARLAVLQGGAQ